MDEGVVARPAARPDLAVCVRGLAEASEWVRRYADGFWQVGSGQTAPRVVEARAWHDGASGLLGRVRREGRLVPLPMGGTGRRLDLGGAVVVASDEGRLLVLRASSARCRVVGDSADRVGLTAFRLAREWVTQALLDEGWLFVHGSVATHARHGSVLVTGPKGAGKTATCLSLAREANWSVSANDRALVGPDGALVSWPSSLNIGLGLVWHLGCHAALAPDDHAYRQRPEVTEALRSGYHGALRDPDGRELKVQVFPARLRKLGVRVGAPGRLILVVEPQLRWEARSHSAEPLPGWGERLEIFPLPDQPEHYPDFLGFGTCGLRERGRARQSLVRRLEQVTPSVRLWVGTASRESLGSVLGRWLP